MGAIREYLQDLAVATNAVASDLPPTVLDRGMVRSLRADCVRTATAIGGSSGWEMTPASWLSAAKDPVLAALWTPGYVKTSAKRCPHACYPSTCRMNEHWEGVAARSSQMNERISTRSEAVVFDTSRGSYSRGSGRR